MNELVLSVLTSVFASTVAIGLLAFVARTWIGEKIKGEIQHEYAQKLEAHKAILRVESEGQLETLKARLSAESAKATEQFKSALQRQTNEHQIRFSRWHERVAETVAEVYARLSEFHNEVATYTNPVEWSVAERPEKRARAIEAMRLFKAYYRPKAIYLPQPTRERIDVLTGRLFDAMRSYMIDVENDAEGRRNAGGFEVWTTMSQSIPPLMAALENDLQAILRCDATEESSQARTEANPTAAH